VASPATLRIVGVDDWAIRKGQTYGTILVDLERRRVIDVLEDRTSDTLATWLKQHPDIRIIARDRSTEYAKGASEGAPQAQQVADRWHLLLNVTQMVERFLNNVHARLRQLPSTPTPEAVDKAPRRRPGPFRRTQAEEKRRGEHRRRRLQLYHQIKGHFEAGMSICAISRELKLTRSTVRKYAYAQSFPERSEMALKPSILDPYLDYLTARHAQGCECASLLWREIQEQGFPGSRRQVAKWMREVRKTPAPTTPGTFREAVRLEKELSTPSKQKSAPPKLPSARQLAWLLVRERSALPVEDELTLVRVLQDTDVAHVYTLAKAFVEMVRQQEASRLDEWLETATKSSVTPLRTFAAGKHLHKSSCEVLRAKSHNLARVRGAASTISFAWLLIKQDYSAVRAALETSWSNGQTEGRVTKLKLIKRAMYGRANFDLLRQRVLLEA
jgi:transposase